MREADRWTVSMTPAKDRPAPCLGGERTAVCIGEPADSFPAHAVGGEREKRGPVYRVAKTVFSIRVRALKNVV